MKFKTIALIIVSCAISYIVCAVEIQFTNLEGSIEELYYKEGGEKIYISSVSGELTPGFEYEDKTLRLYHDIVEEDGKIKEDLVVREKLPGDTLYLIAVLIKKPKSDEAFCYFIDNSPLARPATSITTVNLSDHKVALRLGKKDFYVDPGKHTMSLADPKRQGFVISVAAENSGDWKLVFSNLLPLREGVRVLILIKNWTPGMGKAYTVVDFSLLFDSPPVIEPTAAR